MRQDNMLTLLPMLYLMFSAAPHHRYVGNPCPRAQFIDGPLPRGKALGGVVSCWLTEHAGCTASCHGTRLQVLRASILRQDLSSP
ncbi:uncharacterized protein F4822DRAFT_396070 [Hypoxylon trugodes]|uniref:uncharacterized protein n=1 Tax=Hypoxylon trugodes TaxID=326681 RepID=UPI00219FC816|nr:uncharacterized protein F4822DRAFT_396070 [Hypoxylon trugodes]KAI1391234.1 hypothetical protein F4822DRAFT_396070 [Hypoxylon trugodes]